MPTKKKSTVQPESDDVPVREPKKSLASIKSFKRETDAATPKSASAKAKAKVKAEPTGKRPHGPKMLTVLSWTVFGILLFAAVGAAIYFYRAYRQATDAKPVVNETERLVARLSQFMELPQGEVPTLATVTDQSKLAGQDFFQKAENGDQVLIYQTAGKAILFRPSTGKIVNFAPVSAKGDAGERDSAGSVSHPANVASTEPAQAGDIVAPVEPTEQQPAQASRENARIELYNGSTTLGITAKIEKTILTRYADSMEVVGKESAANKDYVGTSVVDLSGLRAHEASQLADLLGGTVSNAGLPDGETAPQGADILVIIGNVKK
ncbi:MAG TPA: hypothetical protein VN420_05115 [Candidatus Fimivivens sp.]|nr:hypothetical protein [Candidatus Fimivivens sp.]